MVKKIKFSLAIPLAPYRECEILGHIKKLDYPKSHYEVLIEEGFNPSDNRNNSVKRAKHAHIYFLDDDGVIPKDFLKNANKLFTKHKDLDMIGGPQLTPPDDGTFARISGYAMESFFGFFKMSKRCKRGELDLDADELSLTTANCCIKKKVFKKIDGFNPKLFPGEDPEMFDRIKRAGYKIAYSPDVIMYHRRRPTLKAMVKQIYSYGKVRQKKEEILGKKPKAVFFIPSLFTLYLGTLPFWLYLHTAFLLPLLLYIAISIVSATKIAIQEKSPVSLILVPIIYFFIHVSYGIGMIAHFFDEKTYK